VARPEANARADAWLERVGLAAFAAHYPSKLSGGMRKRVAMAQNWIIDRGMLLMDEPFSALDVHTRLRMETELLTLWEGRSSESLALHDRANGGRGFSPPLAGNQASFGDLPMDQRRPASPNRKTVVFVTHDLEEAIALADEVIVLSAGPAARVVARHHVTLGRPRDLMELRTSPAFVDLYGAIWVVLREEVIKSQRSAEASRG
jgi:NitT/TauT family transport system ATP-binding protein